jgi:hypothetical protein
MTDTPAVIKERLIHYAQYVGITFVVVLLIVGLFGLWRFFFPTKTGNVNKPMTVITPFARVGKIDNTSTQTVIEKEKPWEVGAGVGVLRYDNKDGWIVGAEIKRKF